MTSEGKTTRSILLSHWLIVLLGIPIWYFTTYVPRHSLPSERVEAWNTRRPCFLNALERKDGGCGAETTNGGNPAKDRRVLPYSKDVELVFSLLNEDSSVGGGIMDWDVNLALRDQILPVLSALEPLHNFSIETQISYYAPLSIQPIFDQEEQNWMVEEEDLKAFVNSAEWNLASTSATSKLHFILFAPSPRHRPLTIKGRKASSFITPQWGGVALYNPPSSATLSPSDLAHPFSLFASQLSILLGVPSLSSSTSMFSSVHLSSLLRDRTYENIDSSLVALQGVLDLTRRITNMPISIEVQADFTSALDALDNVMKATTEKEQLKFSAEAREVANRAFFNPKMVSMLYFPDEHKYAVITPFLGPLATYLLAATFKAVKAWRKEKKEKIKIE
ncbi:hypothetical protein BT69DRAFT_1351086 [Atractiella rhizophila]|nr:hypothetical protein BT69DRAFT_1351086 [Atractiella rhizophila]